jgi:hypothetical protein
VSELYLQIKSTIFVKYPSAENLWNSETCQGQPRIVDEKNLRITQHNHQIGGCVAREISPPDYRHTGTRRGIFVVGDSGGEGTPARLDRSPARLK